MKYAPDDVGRTGPAGGLEVSVSIEGDGVVVALSGEIDLANAASLPAVVAGVVNGDTSVVIDLTDVTFLDSSGLRAILICEASLAAQGVSLRVAHPTLHVRRVFEITSLGHLLTNDT
jgi:anti-anti-sigma factor